MVPVGGLQHALDRCHAKARLDADLRRQLVHLVDSGLSSSLRLPASSGNLKFGLANPGPHQSSFDMVSRHSCQVLRERSVSRFSLGKPISKPKWLAPSPTSITWPVCSITVFASSETFLMSSTPATEPAMRVGPCMQQESSWTTHSSLGRPPSPTLSSLGSSSGPVMTCITASSVSPPLVSTA